MKRESQIMWHRAIAHYKHKIKNYKFHCKLFQTTNITESQVYEYESLGLLRDLWSTKILWYNNKFACGNSNIITIPTSKMFTGTTL